MCILVEGNKIKNGSDGWCIIDENKALEKDNTVAYSIAYGTATEMLELYNNIG